MAGKKGIPPLDVTTPFYAAVGVGDLAVEAVSSVVERIRETAETATSEVLDRVNEAKAKYLPQGSGQVGGEGDMRDLAAKFSPEELRKAAEVYGKVALDVVRLLAERGEEATRRLRKQPEAQEARQAVAEQAEEDLGLTDEALGKVASGTRALGEEASKAAEAIAARGRPTAAKKNDDSSE